MVADLLVNWSRVTGSVGFQKMHKLEHQYCEGKHQYGHLQRNDPLVLHGRDILRLKYKFVGLDERRPPGAGVG